MRMSRSIPARAPLWNSRWSRVDYGTSRREPAYGICIRSSLRRLRQSCSSSSFLDSFAGRGIPPLDSSRVGQSQPIAPVRFEFRALSQLQADGEGFEPVSPTPYVSGRLLRSSKTGEAESEAVCLDSELKAVVEAWSFLPDS